MAQIIRSGRTLQPRAFSFDDLEAHAAVIRAAAQQQSEAILQRARAEATRVGAELRRSAHEQGLREGRAQGLEQIRRETLAHAQREAKQQQAHVTAALSEALRSFESSKRRLLASAETGLVAVALAIAQRVCKAFVGRSSEAACANARSVLELVKHERDLELRVHPGEADAVRSHLADALQQTQHIQVISDPKVAAGGCQLELREGTVDAGIDAQIQRIAEALLGPSASQEPHA